MNSAPLIPRADPLVSAFATNCNGLVSFMAVVAEGSFARAGERLGLGRSAVSRNVQKLEERLNVRLFVRTTRSTKLTPEGELFYTSCQPAVLRIVHAMDRMRDFREGPPQGHLRVSAAVGFGRRIVGPLVHEFMAAYPDVTVDLLLDDKQTNFLAERVDVSFRNGRMKDAEIIAVQLVPMKMFVCASPSYIDAHGRPETIEDLSLHECINFRLASGRIFEWEFLVEGKLRKFAPTGKVSYNDLDLLLQAVVAGRGIAQLAPYLAREELMSGELVPCMADLSPDDRGHYICYLSRQHMPSRMRAFIDFMTTRIREMDFECINRTVAATAKNSKSSLEDEQSRSGSKLASLIALEER